MVKSRPDDVIGACLELLDEAVRPSPDQWTYFTNPTPDAGYSGILSALSYQDATQRIGTTSIAQVVRHVIFVMQTHRRSVSGMEAPDAAAWEESWREIAGEEAAWKALCERFHEEYALLRASIAQQPCADPEAIRTLIGLVAHLAYHLGAIKQKQMILGV